MWDRVLGNRRAIESAKIIAFGHVVSFPDLFRNGLDLSGNELGMMRVLLQIGKFTVQYHSYIIIPISDDPLVPMCSDKWLPTVLGARDTVAVSPIDSSGRCTRERIHARPMPTCLSGVTYSLFHL